MIWMIAYRARRGGSNVECIECTEKTWRLTFVVFADCFDDVVSVKC